MPQFNGPFRFDGSFFFVRKNMSFEKKEFDKYSGGGVIIMYKSILFSV